MRDLVNKSKNRTDKRLAERERELVSNTQFDWDAIKPELSDPEEQRVLMDAVQEAAKHNENIGQLHDRLKALGEKGVSVADKLASLL